MISHAALRSLGNKPAGPQTPVKMAAVTMPQPHYHLTRIGSLRLRQRDRVRHFSLPKRFTHRSEICRHSSPARRWRESPALLRRTGHNPATYSSDPACWDKIDEDMRACWIKMGPESWQNKDAGVCYSLCWRDRRRKKQADESTEPDYERSGRDKFRTTVFIAVTDRLDRRITPTKIFSRHLDFGMRSHPSPYKTFSQEQRVCRRNMQGI
ncbi:unnamed protein product [Leuciscus chuanchicus]